jgi:hypothetical protein
MANTKLQIGIAVALLFLLATAIKPQIPAVGEVWEYCSVTASTSAAPSVPGAPVSYRTRVSVCYAASDGCRNEQMTGSSRAEESVMMAARTLGQKGWELTAAVDTGTDRTLYFRRRESAINRNDSQSGR